MTYTEEQIKQAMTEWATESFNCELEKECDEFADISEYETVEEWIEANIESTFKYLNK